ncbi:MAG TPA: BatA domain-containing protein [Pirellulaceae bacterium]|nr:BatA domain-containing protein [Pirellulaceae bacterium]HMO93257.1 BatA domain-containing protein [Pirellulaceae bacterium]
MALANGLVLAFGALLISVPIVLHLLMQPKPKLLTFPALRFVKQREQTNRRQLQLRHWLLLLLRCLLIAAAVLALAGISTSSATFGAWSVVALSSLVSLLSGLILIAILIWTRPLNRLLLIIFGTTFIVSAISACFLTAQTLRNPMQQILGNRIAPVSAVILIDNSTRMDFIFENRSRLEQARELSRWLIEQFPQDSQVSIAIPDGSEPFFSVDISAAEKRLETLNIDFAANALPTAIGPALKLLAESTNERRELYIVSDLTRRSWRDHRNLAQLVDRYPTISIYLIDVGVDNPRNAAVGTIQFSAEVLSQTAPLEINSEVVFQGEAIEGVATLSIEIPDPARPIRADGQNLYPDQFITRQQIVQPQGRSRVPLRFVVNDQLPPGTHHGHVEFQSGDGLSVDDRRYFTIQTAQVWKVLVVALRGVETDNLVQILSPVSFVEQGIHEYECTVVGQEQLSRISEVEIKQYKAVFLLDPRPLSDGNWNLLANFAEQGGGVALFLGRNAALDGQIAESFNSASARRLLPGQISQIFRAPRSQESAIFLVPASASHPILRPFMQIASRARWDLLPIHQHWGWNSIDNDDTASVEILFRFSNARPALIERRLGLGTVLLTLTPISEPNVDSRWNDLFYDLGQCWPAFLLVKQAADYLVASRESKLNLALGEAAILNNDRSLYPTEYRIFTPRNEEPLRISADQGQIRYRLTDLPGHYRLKGSLQGVVLRGFSCNLDEGETDLARVDLRQFDQWFGENRLQYARNQQEVAREQGVVRVGREFYPYLILLMLILLAAELLLANHFYYQSTVPSFEKRLAP